jgi:hypothetical protein
MMGRLKSDQGQLFYKFHLGDAVPKDHLVRKIDTALDLSWLRGELAPHYSSMGRPSIDPELMIRMLVVGYVFAIRDDAQRRFGRSRPPSEANPQIPLTDFSRSRRVPHDISRSKEATELAKWLYPDGARNLVNDDLFMRETSPPEVTTDILDLCGDLARGSPVFVDVAPTPTARSGWCFANVAAAAAAEGGEACHGWTIWGAPGLWTTRNSMRCCARREGT